MKNAFLAFCGALLLVSSLALPVSAEESATPTMREDLRKALEEARTRLQGDRAEYAKEKPKEAHREAKADRAEMKILLDEERKKRIENRISAFQNRSNALWLHLKTQDERIERLVQKFDEKGTDTVSITSLLSVARQELEIAKAAVLKAEMEARQALEAIEVSREALVGAIERGVGARNKALSAYRAIVPELKKLSINTNTN